jgi:Domain of unknown function (DUF397)
MPQPRRKMLLLTVRGNRLASAPASAVSSGKAALAAASPAARPDLNRGHRHAIVVRDSKNPHGPVLVLAPEDWQRFTCRVKVR